MTEVWLRNNRRVLLVAVAAVLMAGHVGLIFALDLPRADLGVAPRAAGWALVALATFGLAALLRALRRPRIVREDDELLLYLRRGAPIRVPLEVVECFFMGQAPSGLAGADEERTKTRTVVVRFASRATDWAERDVAPRLAAWRDGYIAIRGTWCEPLYINVVNSLNHRLADVQRANR